MATAGGMDTATVMAEVSVGIKVPATEPPQFTLIESTIPRLHTGHPVAVTTLTAITIASLTSRPGTTVADTGTTITSTTAITTNQQVCDGSNELAKAKLKCLEAALATAKSQAIRDENSQVTRGINAPEPDSITRPDRTKSYLPAAFVFTFQSSRFNQGYLWRVNHASAGFRHG